VIDVLVVDDQELVRSAFAILLRSAPGLRVVGEAADGEEAIRLARQLKPRVVLMDVRMPRTDGLQATARIAQDPECADVRVLILTTFDQDDLVHAALRAGASGFLLKDTPPAQLLTAIQVVADGEALLAPTVTRRLIEHFVGLQATAPDGAILRGLTERERDVLAAVADGRSNAEIAEALYMGYGTVKTHVSHLLTKLGARDRAQLVVLAYESGLVVPGRRPD
jgi:DNA-binding NarL/FixJ family response regulator